MLKADFHMHTNLCDGKNTPEEMVIAAIDIGLKHMGFSGHFDPENGVHMDIKEYLKEIRRVKEKYKDRIDILLGGEIDCLYPEPEIERELEYVIGSTHSALYNGNVIPVDDTEEKLDNACKEYFGGDYLKLAREYYRTEAGIADKIHPDFIGHFDLVTRFNDSMHFLDESNPAYVKYALEAMEYLVKKDIPFEINCGAYNRKRKKDLYPNIIFLRALHDLGGRIVINSDAHETGKITGGFEKAVENAVSCGFTHTGILIHNEKGSVEWKELALDEL